MTEEKQSRSLRTWGAGAAGIIGGAALMSFVLFGLPSGETLRAQLTNEPSSQEAVASPANASGTEPTPSLAQTALTEATPTPDALKTQSPSSEVTTPPPAIPSTPQAVAVATPTSESEVTNSQPAPSPLPSPTKAKTKRVSAPSKDAPVPHVKPKLKSAPTAPALAPDLQNAKRPSNRTAAKVVVALKAPTPKPSLSDKGTTHRALPSSPSTERRPPSSVRTLGHWTSEGTWVWN